MGIPLQLQGSFGVGLYSFADAARFIGAETRELRRWMQGYSTTRAGSRHEYGPLWVSQVADFQLDGVGFRDLVELRFIHTFVDAGVPLLLIRRAIDELRERLGHQYPFTSTAFKTDGRRIFMEILDDNGDQALVDVVKRQNVITRVIGPSLREGIELNVDDEATKWYPLARSKSVVFDPERSFGQPILTESGIPTIAIVEAFEAEGRDVGRVARLYEISSAEVNRALLFEKAASA
uniref:DUF433 domain-containing protein n=1 Tax=Xanthomonas sp. 0924 TaxID=2835534 RepID=UPI003F8149BB